MSHDLTVHVHAEGDEPDLVGILTTLMREAIRLRSKAVRIGNREAGILEWEFIDKPTVVESFPTWLVDEIHRSQEEVFPLVAQELGKHKIVLAYTDNEFRVTSPENFQTTLRIIIS